MSISTAYRRGCGFFLLVLICFAVVLLPMVNKAKQAAQSYDRAYRNKQFLDSGEQLIEKKSDTGGEDSDSGGLQVPFAYAYGLINILDAQGFICRKKFFSSLFIFSPGVYWEIIGHWGASFICSLEINGVHFE